MLRITDILDKAQVYLQAEELEMIEKAYIYSATVHQGQVRLSGEPYLTHPMEVAGILTDMKMDSATIISGLLHDTIEDTLTTREQIEQEFGKDVAFLVNGLTKLSRISFASQEERQAENFRKMILAMSSAIRFSWFVWPTEFTTCGRFSTKRPTGGFTLPVRRLTSMRRWPIVWESTG